MPPLALSDAAMAAVMDAARPLAPDDRTAFLADVVAELEKHRELGDGLVARTVREMLGRHYRPPDFSRMVRVRKYGL